MTVRAETHLVLNQKMAGPGKAPLALLGSASSICPHPSQPNIQSGGNLARIPSCGHTLTQRRGRVSFYSLIVPAAQRHVGVRSAPWRSHLMPVTGTDGNVLALTPRIF